MTPGEFKHGRLFFGALLLGAVVALAAFVVIGRGVALRASMACNRCWHTDGSMRWNAV